MNGRWNVIAGRTAHETPCTKLDVGRTTTTHREKRFLVLNSSSIEAANLLRVLMLPVIRQPCNEKPALTQRATPRARTRDVLVVGQVADLSMPWRRRSATCPTTSTSLRLH